jgi:hypothetical protein
LHFFILFFNNYGTLTRCQNGDLSHKQVKSDQQAGSDEDTDPALHFDPDPVPTLPKKAENLRKCSNRLIFHTSYILASHLQIDPYPCPDPVYLFDPDRDPNPAYHIDAGPDPTFQFNADPELDPKHCRTVQADNVYDATFLHARRLTFISGGSPGERTFLWPLLTNCSLFQVIKAFAAAMDSVRKHVLKLKL